MVGSAHILILGAGLIGVSVADELLRRGARVTLIDANDPMSGASFANSGMIHPSQACSWSGPANATEVDKAVFDLAMRSRAVLASRMETLGLDMMRTREAGCYQIFETDAELEAARMRLSARGIAAEPVVEVERPLSRPALYFPEDRSGDARAYGQALLADVVARGGEIRAGAAAQLEQENGRVIATVRGERIDSDHIVLACGWETETLLTPLGLSLGIKPVRGWALDFARPDGLNLPGAPIMDARTRSALTVFEDRIRLSGTLGETSPDLLRKRWMTLLPGLFVGAPEPRLVWSGLRPVSPLGRPFIGHTGVSNLWVNAGHGHMGWTLCAGSGELLARMIMTGHTDDRFSLSDA